jgi:hypothetical protein
MSAKQSKRLNHGGHEEHEEGGDLEFFTFVFFAVQSSAIKA